MYAYAVQTEQKNNVGSELPTHANYYPVSLSLRPDGSRASSTSTTALSVYLPCLSPPLPPPFRYLALVSIYLGSILGHTKFSDHMENIHTCGDNGFGPQVNHCRGGFDFTLLFEECFFSIVPSVLLLLALPIRYRNCDRLEFARSRKIGFTGRSWYRRPLDAIGVLQVLTATFP